MSSYRRNAILLYEAAVALGLARPCACDPWLVARGRHRTTDGQGCDLGALLARYTTYARGLAMRVLEVEPDNEAAGFMTVFVELNRVPHQAALGEKVRRHTLRPVEVLALMEQAWGKVDA